ncbi:acyl transferase/acyl hydrolase/lysophospholipase [Geopyxis carbonaria]|nr:acyl transferase/acyl hydrolase/lysophospholipase [Geopyxis carbonaria]
MLAATQERGIRLLALDGGGIRGLSELIILESLMHRIKHDKQLDKIPRPCDYFDLIGGTSTGGLIAIMLGRLQMTIPEAIKQYSDLAERVFSQQKWLWQDGKFKATALQEAIKEVVRNYGVLEDPEETMLDDRSIEGCKTFVCAVPSKHPDSPRRLRSYTVRESQGYNDCKIWEAARATTAASTFFKHIAIGTGGIQEVFVDAGLGCNNPVRQVIEEAHNVFGSTSRNIDCIISIGTGQSQVVSLEKPNFFQKILPIGLVRVLKHLATESEKTAEAEERRYSTSPGLYFRFNVEHGMQGTTLEEWRKLGDVKTSTMKYLEGSRVSEKVDSVVKILTGEQNPLGRIRIAEINGPVLRIPEYEINKHYFVPYSSSFMFTGRDLELKEINEYFLQERKGTAQQRRVMVLHGLGGSGKTQICLKFLETAREKFWGIFWVDTSTAETIEKSFGAIADTIGNIMDRSSDSVKYWFTSCRENWLIIFDNADDPELDVSTYFPPGNLGNIIITTRVPECRRHAPDSTIAIGDMMPEEAVELLLKVADKANSPSDIVRVEAEKIVKELGHLALAIDQAGAYIANCCPIENYLKRHEKHRNELMKRPVSQRQSYKESVYTTWELSFTRICEKNKTASDILQILAFFHYDNISQEIFKKADKFIQQEKPSDVPNLLSNLKLFPTHEDGEWDSLEFDDAIRTLASFSLIKRHVDIYSIHPLVHSWAYDRLSESERRPYRASAIGLLGYSIPWTTEDSDYKFRTKLLLHVARCHKLSQMPDLAPYNILFSFGLVYNDAGMWSQVELFSSELVAKLRETLGDVHPDTLRSIDSLAATYQNQGRYKEAEELQVDVLAKHRETLGDVHPHTLSSMNNLASIYHRQGRYQEAEELQVDVLAKRRETLGDVHPDTVGSMNNVASTYHNQGRYQEAEELQVDVLAKRRETLGDVHPGTLRSMNNLAATYQNQGRYQEAEELQVDVLAKHRETLGDVHPHTLTSMNNLAATYQNQGRYQEAEELHVDVLAKHRETLGDVHPDTLRSMNNLASTYSNQGRYQEALDLLEELLHLDRSYYGAEHEEPKRTERSIAYVREKLNSSS